jgi:hypothetical protein
MPTAEIKLRILAMNGAPSDMQNLWTENLPSAPDEPAFIVVRAVNRRNNLTAY